METDEVVKQLEALTRKYETKIAALEAEMDRTYLQHEMEKEEMEGLVSDLKLRVYAAERGQISQDLEAE